MDRKATEMARTMVVFGAVVLLACGGGMAATNWYAEVETSAGNFTIELDWDRAPNGCHAFAGLAEGLADWVDPRSGLAEHGLEYYPGTAVSWNQHDASSETLLLANRGRVFVESDGTTNTANGAGVMLEDDLRDGRERRLPARSVAMMNAAGPDSLDGQWAVFLKDGDAYYGGRWSRIGTVASNWTVVVAMALREREPDTGVMKEPATVTGLRVWSDPPEAMAEWRQGATNFPVCSEQPLDLRVAGSNGTVRFAMEAKSQYSFVRKGDLMAAGIVFEDWNEENECLTNELTFLTVPDSGTNDGIARFGSRHFFSEGVSERAYPELTGPVLPGAGYALLTEWQWGDGTLEQYLHVLDWSAGTGMVWKATEDGGWTNTARVAGMGYWRAGAHNGELAMAEVVQNGIIAWTYYYYYWLGASGGNGLGRFRMQVFAGFSGTVEVWGDYGWVRASDVLSKPGKTARNAVVHVPCGGMTRAARECRGGKSLPPSSWLPREKWPALPPPRQDGRAK